MHRVYTMQICEYTQNSNCIRIASDHSTPFAKVVEISYHNKAAFSTNRLT